VCTFARSAEEFGLQTPDYYFYLNQGKTYTVDGMDDNQEFQDTWVPYHNRRLIHVQRRVH
jgi:myosin heavy subunit